MIDIRKYRRWIRASIVKKLKSLPTDTLPLFIEEDEKKINADHFELRIDGPYTNPLGTRGEYRFYIEVNFLLTTDRNEKQIYKRDDHAGIMCNFLNDNFCIYRYGTLPEDDKSIVGVMQLISDQEIKLSDFGIIDDNVEVYQMGVEAHYQMFLQIN